MGRKYWFLIGLIIITIILILIPKEQTQQYANSSDASLSNVIHILNINRTEDLKSIEEINEFKQRKLTELNQFIKKPIDYDEIEYIKVNQTETESYVRHNINIRLSKDDFPFYSIPGYIMIPKQGKMPFPTIIGMHGHWGDYSIGNKEFLNESVKSFKAEEFIEQGYVFAAFDSVLFGERMYNGENTGKISEEISTQKLYMLGHNPMEVIIQDNEIVADFVNNVNIVDKERINCVGHSFGGLKCLWLSALDKRIKTTVISGYVMKTESLVNPGCGIKSEWITIMPGLLEHTNMEGILTLISPRNLLIINGLQDPVFPAQKAIPVIKYLSDIYIIQNKSDNFAVIISNSSHEVTGEISKNVYKWLGEKNAI